MRQQAATLPTETAPEPISPELVLVDPELRRVVLDRLLEELLLEALPQPGSGPSQAKPAPALEPPSPEPLPQPVAPRPLSAALRRAGKAPRRRRKRRLAPALLPVSLAVNVIVIALSVSDARIARTSPEPLVVGPPPSELAPPATKTTARKKAQRPAARTPKRRAAKAKPAVAKRSAKARVTRGKVEQKVLTAVIQSPAGKLPRRLIDPKTGLAKNGLQARCRAARSASFLCVVRPVRHKGGEGLHVRYRLNRKGKAAFTWYPYRSG